MTNRALAHKFHKFFRAGVWATPLLLLVTLFGWGLASPVGSSPDDDFHIASIWCAYGERTGLCEAADQPDQRKVPLPIVHMTCFAFHPEIDGSCQNGQVEEPSTGVHPVAHGNWNGQTYPPVFYATMGIFASENVAISVVAIRLFNALLATVLLTLTMLALPSRLQPVLGFSAVIAMIPLGVFSLASTNPSSWALLSAAMVFPALLGISETAGKRRIALSALAVVGAVLGAGARADAAAYAVFAALLAWFLAGKHTRWNTSITILICIVGAISFFTSGQSEGLGGLSVEDDAPSAGVSLIFYNITQLPALWMGMFDNLGWLDTAISPLAIFASVFAAIAIIFVGIGNLGSRKGLAMLSVAGSLALLPLYVLYGSNASVGAQVQPRYVLPLLIILLAVAIVPEPRTVALSRPQLWVMASLLAVGHAVALYDTLTRYVAGRRIVNLDSGGWWWSGSPLSPMGVLIVTAFAGALLIGMLAWKFLDLQSSPTYKDGSGLTTKLEAPVH